MRQTYAEYTDHNNDDSFGSVGRREGCVYEGSDHSVRDESGQVPGIRSGLYQRYGAHGPVAAQVTREHQ